MTSCASGMNSKILCKMFLFVVRRNDEAEEMLLHKQASIYPRSNFTQIQMNPDRVQITRITRFQKCFLIRPFFFFSFFARSASFTEWCQEFKPAFSEFLFLCLGRTDFSRCLTYEG